MLTLLAIINYELLLRKWLYLGMLALLVLSSFGAPIPEDIPLLLAGCLCRLGYGHWFYATLVGLGGVLFGDMLLYFLGRRFGMGVLNMRPFNLLFTRTHIAQMKLVFRRWGHFIIFFGRFFAGVRSVMCVTAGVCQVPAWKFILVDVSGAMVTVPLLVGLGWLFSASIAKLTEGMLAVEHVLAGLAAAGIAGWIIYIHLAKTRRKAIVRRLAAPPASEATGSQSEGKEEVADDADCARN
ncbi:MAG: DedA family protein [Phycisphaerae bacterium]|nr:DedA family protein [Phycisphaerae bacterium]